MKYYILFITVLLGAPSYAQSDIQIVKIKHEDGSVSVSAINHSDIVYSITVDINLEGMKLEYPIKSYIKIFPGDEKEVAILKPTAN